jgi:hypothetical protein
VYTRAGPGRLQLRLPSRLFLPSSWPASTEVEDLKWAARQPQLLHAINPAAARFYFHSESACCAGCSPLNAGALSRAVSGACSPPSAAPTTVAADSPGICCCIDCAASDISPMNQTSTAAFSSSRQRTRREDQKGRCAPATCWTDRSPPFCLGGRRRMIAGGGPQRLPKGDSERQRAITADHGAGT